MLHPSVHEANSTWVGFRRCCQQIPTAAVPQEAEGIAVHPLLTFMDYIHSYVVPPEGPQAEHAQDIGVCYLAALCVDPRNDVCSCGLGLQATMLDFDCLTRDRVGSFDVRRRMLLETPLLAFLGLSWALGKAIVRNSSVDSIRHRAVGRSGHRAMP